jgi:hypothetical protein
VCRVVLILTGCRSSDGGLGLRVRGLKRRGIRNGTDTVVRGVIPVFQGILVLGPSPAGLVCISLWVRASIVVFWVFFLNPSGRLGKCQAVDESLVVIAIRIAAVVAATAVVVVSLTITNKCRSLEEGRR